MSAGSLGEHAVALRTIDPDERGAEDLEAVRELVGDARVVCLGESAHGVSEFLRFKDRVSRFLVDELGFSAFVQESGFAEGLAVDEWVLGGAGDLDRVATDGITWGFGRCPEMRAQLGWMRDRNMRRGGEVRFYGMDMPGSCANPADAVRVCLQRLGRQRWAGNPAGDRKPPPNERELPDDGELLRLADLGERFAAPAHHAAMTAEQRHRLSGGLVELVERAARSGDEIAHRCAWSAQQLDQQLGDGCYRREDVMADTVRWILEREDRIVISAHNAHVQRGRLVNDAPSLGALLAPVLGEQMVVIGTTRASGRMPEMHPGEPPSFTMEDVGPPPAGAIDAVMDEAGLPLHLVDLRKVPEEKIGAAAAMCGQSGTLEVDVPSAFDGLVHVRHLTEIPEFWDYLQDALARS